jgi:FkbM family methyltransferase
MIQWIKAYFYRRFRTSFSKAGEDIQLWQLLKKKHGTYVDIGAHHPIFGNNTYFFYLRDWKGINVEPNPKFEPLHKRFRKRDIFFAGGVGAEDGEMTYFELESNLRNTFSEKYISNFQLEGEVKSSKNLPVQKLSTLFKKFLNPPYSIDFMTIDVEGMELDVVKSNDWSKFRPKFILLESHCSLEEDLDSEISKFLLSKDYQLISKSLQGYQLGTLWFRAKEVKPI